MVSHILKVGFFFFLCAHIWFRLIYENTYCRTYIQIIFLQKGFGFPSSWVKLAPYLTSLPLMAFDYCRMSGWLLDFVIMQAQPSYLISIILGPYWCLLHTALGYGGLKTVFKFSSPSFSVLSLCYFIDSWGFPWKPSIFKYYLWQFISNLLQNVQQVLLI